MEMKTMRTTPARCLLFGLMALASCGDKYEETTRSVPVSPFTTLHINSVFNIYLVEDTQYMVEVVGDEDAVGQIEASVEGEALTLTDHNKRKWLKPEENKIKVYVHSPEHNMIYAKSSYSLQSVNTIASSQLYIVNQPEVKVSEIDITIDCQFVVYWNNYLAGGHLILKGRCEDMEINNYALHSVNTVALNTRRGVINSYAKGDCEIYVTERLEYQLEGPGNIYLYGNPAEIVLLDQTPAGRLIKMN
jgi:hypothetical protein